MPHPLNASNSSPRLPQAWTRTTTHYAGGFVYESSSASPDTTLRYFSYGNGRIVALNEDGDDPERSDAKYTGLAYEYHLADHLGNTRVAYRVGEGSSEPNVTQTTSYYPYGLRWGGQTLAEAGDVNEHLYNGKELAEELDLNWSHYGARYYATALTRWAQMDPADEFYSPYVYVGGDPINLVDPDGRQSETVQEQCPGPCKNLMREVVVTASMNEAVEFMSYQPQSFLHNALTAEDVVPSVRDAAMKAAIRQGQRRSYNHPVTELAKNLLPTGALGQVFKSAYVVGKSYKTGKYIYKKNNK